MCRGRDSIGLSCRYGNATLKAFKLQCNLALIVIHRNHGVEVTLECTDEQRIRGERANNALSLDVCLGNCGLEYINFLPAASAAVTAVRVDCRNGNLGILITGTLERFISQIDNTSGELLHRSKYPYFT